MLVLLTSPDGRERLLEKQTICFFVSDKTEIVSIIHYYLRNVLPGSNHYVKDAMN